MHKDTDPKFFDYLKGLDMKNVWVSGMPEGTVVFGSEPLLIFEGPIGICTLLETPILNFINFASLITTNASWMVIRAGENVKCIELGLRRA